jgi:peptidoglycan/xylan/chitin deacetylase (PgdA/CDA1 family)
MYHRITDVKPDPWRLCTTAQHFAEHLEVLQKFDCSLRLDQLAHALRQGKIPRRSVVVTFDDGYVDNLHTAKPLLERYSIPSTFFLSTGCIKQYREFWWDELDRILLQPVLLPDTLQLRIKGELYEWNLDNDVQHYKDSLQKHSSWRAWEEAPSMRHKIYYSLWQLLKPLNDNERHHVLDQLQDWAGAKPHVRSTHSPLRPEEISLLATGELIKVGAHSVTHASLPPQSLFQQQDEINQSKIYLENLLGNPVTSFSYPYGDYSAETIALVKHAGFSCACSTRASAIFSNTDRFQLPRLEVHDCDGEMFKNHLLKWLETEWHF